MKKVKKLSALLLSLCMAFVFVASTAFAAEQVADADGITITADTTDEAIAAAWEKGRRRFRKTTTVPIPLSC